MSEERLITHTFEAPGEIAVTLTGVPATVDAETGEVIGFKVAVSRAIRDLVQAAAEGQAPGAAATAAYRAPSTVAPPTPDPVSLELRRALHERGLTGAEIAGRLGIKQPLVSRWLSPSYHQHGMDTLRRIAEALDMDVEVKLTARAD